jgi:glycosyltransferase involved in cell wall biosynthesis
VLARARRTAPPATGADPAQPSDAERIVAAGLLDRAYYEIQCGTSFATDLDAARHFVQQGHRLGFSVHPLFEPEWFRRERPRNRPNTVVVYLDEGGGEHGPGPLFDEASYLALHPEAAGHPGRALGHYLAHAEDDDPLPAPSVSRASRLTWGEARRLAHESAREFAHFEALRSAPRRGPWDERSDRAFVAGRLARGTPDASDGRALVSIVMPVRNRPVQVLEAIESVRAQTLPDWELVVVDDGSTDDTAEVVARVARDDPRIVLERRPPTGVSAARNAGIAAASGEWLGFLDSDNTWVPHFLEVMVGHLRDEGLDAGHAVVDTLNEPDDEDSGRYLAFDGGLEHLLVRNHIDLNALMVRTRVAREAGGFDESLRRWVDHDFAIRVAGLTTIPLVPFVGVRYDHALDSADRITTTEPNYWEWLVLAKHRVDWAEVEQGAAGRRADLVSVCMPSVEDWAYTKVAIDAVLDAADRDAEEGSGAPQIELVLLIQGARRCVGTILRSLYGDDPRVRILSVPRNLNFALGANYAFAASTGQRVVFLDNDTEVLPGWLPPLLAELEDPDVLGSQALLLEPDGSVQHAGWAFAGGRSLPFPLLAHHPVDDARRAAPIRLRAVAASALAMRAADVIGLRGFDPSYMNSCEDVDLCLRAVGDGPRRFSVAPESRVVHHRRRRLARYYDRDQTNRRTWTSRWGATSRPSDLAIIEGLGFEVAHLHPGEPVEGPSDVRVPVPVVTRPARTVPSGSMAGAPCLRWALKTAVPLRDAGRSADLDLAEGLAGALTRLGQDVVVDRLESNQRRSGYLDDVAVLLRGPVPLHDEPGRVNVAWLLGPDVLPAEPETVRYDAVLTTTADGARVQTVAQWRAGSPGSGLLADPGPEALAEAARQLLEHAIALRAERP